MSTLLTDFASMTTPFSGNFNKSNSKRPRSQDSQRSLTPAPALKASKIEEAQDSASVPAFLRQSKAGKLHAMQLCTSTRPELAYAKSNRNPCKV